MAEYIERDKVIKMAETNKAVCLCEAGIVDVQSLVNCVPTADVRPERHGRWIFQKPNANFCGVDDDFIDCLATDFGISVDKTRQIISLLHPWRCSCCGKLSRSARYCQNCGAKMSGGGQ